MERRPYRCGDQPGEWMPAGMSKIGVPPWKEPGNYTLLCRGMQGGGGLEEERREDGEQDGDAEGEQVRRGPVVRAVGSNVCGKNAVEEGHREEHAGAAGERHR